MDELSRCFLCCLPINVLPLERVLHNISWENQSILLNRTVKNPIVVKYPINISYQVAFLKKIIDFLIKLQTEIHDDIYVLHCELLQKMSIKCDFYYKHYNIVTENINYILSLKENPNLISDGTTGLHSWEAGYALSEWCIANDKFFANKIVLELGSGAGLAGIVTFKSCHPKQMWMSDCHDSVLSLLKENVEINFPNKISDQNAPYDNVVIRANANNNNNNSDTIGVLKLPWEKVEAFPSESIPYPDIIIAADVVYDNSVFGALLKTFNYFLNTKRRCEIIMVNTIRNQNTIDEFNHLLHNDGFMVSYVNPPTPCAFYWPPSTNFALYNVSKNVLKEGK